MGLNKKLIVVAGAIALMAFTTILAYKSLEGLYQLDLSDPFETDFDDEE